MELQQSASSTAGAAAASSPALGSHTAGSTSEKTVQEVPAPLVRPGEVVARPLCSLRPRQQAPLAGRLWQLAQWRGRGRPSHVHRRRPRRSQALPPGLLVCQQSSSGPAQQLACDRWATPVVHTPRCMHLMLRALHFGLVWLNKTRHRPAFCIVMALDLAQCTSLLTSRHVRGTRRSMLCRTSIALLWRQRIQAHLRHSAFLVSPPQWGSSGRGAR